MMNSLLPLQRLFLLASALTISAIGPKVAAEEPPTEQLAFFEAKVRPLLAKHCYECHSTKAEKLKGGLLLDSKEGWSAGGDSGDVIEPGNAAGGLLMESVRYKNPDLQMPPKYQLAEAEIAVLETWIAMGAPDPRVGTKVVKAAGIDWQKGKAHWAFQPVSNPTLPVVRNTSWSHDDLDRFILSGLEAANLQPAPDADRFALIRRVTLDLTGLPPTVTEMEAFVRDPATDDEALANVVDRLLSSASFGERWGRHWLDVARYADSVGKTRNVPFPHAWRYRNYVIDAFNADKPYDEFLSEQIAGDLLESSDATDHAENIVATGLLALGSMDLNERDGEQFQLDRIDDQMDTIGRSMMGLTLGCARCHDHKFDPIAQADYYAMAGIFASTKTLSGQQNRQGGNKDYYQPSLLTRLDTPTNAGSVKSTPESKPIDAKPDQEAKIAKLKSRLQELQKDQQNKKLSKPDRVKLREEVVQIRQQLTSLGASAAAVAAGKSKKTANVPEEKPDPSAILAMAAMEGKISDLALRVRGEPDIKGDIIPRAFPVIFKHASMPVVSESGSGRRELAEWMTSREHPLTARVKVNRVWAHLLGRGLVESVDNFGASGAEPTHPELLDHLATRFMDNGWSVKSLVRSIVLSRTYRLSGQHLEANAAADEANRLYWRANLRRLEAEAIRDSLLAAGGLLKSERPANGPFDGAYNVDLAKTKPGKRDIVSDPIAAPVRSVYLPVLRSKLPGMFTVFDFAEPDQVNGQRDVTTVPPQALFMLNNPFVVDVANRTAQHVLNQNLPDEKARIRFAYAYTMSRYPTDAETERALTFLKTGEDLQGNWSTLTQALYSSAEFRYVP